MNLTAFASSDSISTIARICASTGPDSHALASQVFEPGFEDPVSYTQSKVEQLELIPPKLRIVGLTLPVVKAEFEWLVDFDLTTRGIVRDGAIERWLKASATVVVNRIHRGDASLATLVRSLDPTGAATLSINAYLSNPEAISFGWHSDGHDVVVCQLAGAKDWFFKSGSSDKDNGETQVTVQPGDVLSIARDVPHATSTPDLTSLHLTIGFQRDKIDAGPWE